MIHKCLIVDDEPLAIEILESYLKRLPQFEVVGTFHSAVEAFESLQEVLPDLLLIDIKMPGLSGIELLKGLEKRPQVLFTTAYKEYALEGFELDAVDYLLKPFGFPRFQKAIEKYLRLASTETQTAPSEEAHLLVRSEGKWVKIEYEHILFVEGVKDYVKVHLSQKRLMVHATMKDLVDQLPAAQFLRIHRSYIVNWSHVREVVHHSFRINDHLIPIGKTYRSRVLTRLKEWQSLR